MEDIILQAFVPKRYNESAAALDALGGRAACPHGQWPHQAPFCAACVAGVLTEMLKDPLA